MGDRRMLSKKITSSAKFLKMPLETQALYFHLAQNADDDGVVEGFTIMRIIGSSEDSLKVLEAKQYIKVLNEDLVLFIIDWLEHNSIRPDRKIDSIYKSLLIQQMPEIKLIEPKERSDRKKKDINGTSQGQPKDGVSKDKISKDKISKINYAPSVNMKKEQYEKLIEKFGEAGTKDRIENLSLYKQSKGKKYKCDYSTILAWSRKEEKPSIPVPSKKSKEEILGVDAEIEEYYKKLGG